MLALKAEDQENTCRKGLRPTEILALGERLEKLLQPEAEKRKADSIPSKGKRGFQCAGKLPAHEKGRGNDAIAAAGGVSRKTYEKIKAVVAAAKADPALVPIVEEMDRMGNVNRVARKVAAKADEQAKAAEQPQGR
ncbi:MAG: hypothetical protein HY674_16510 [Chloroflexi bacterium]|nr:hypothetical protein [Chloroflexota bacterium]